MKLTYDPKSRVHASEQEHGKGPHNSRTNTTNALGKFVDHLTAWRLLPERNRSAQKSNNQLIVCRFAISIKPAAAHISPCSKNYAKDKMPRPKSTFPATMLPKLWQ